MQALAVVPDLNVFEGDLQGEGLLLN